MIIGESGMYVMVEHSSLQLTALARDLIGVTDSSSTLEDLVSVFLDFGLPQNVNQNRV